MSNVETEAYQWWNSQINEKFLLSKPSLSSNISPPECIMPQKSFIVMANVFPFLQYLNADQTDIQKYWEFVQKVISFFYPDQLIPNPISHFPEFIVKLYSIRDFLLPKSIPMCLKFIDIFIDRIAITGQISSEQRQNKNINKIKHKNSDSTNLNQIICSFNSTDIFFCKAAPSFCLYNLPLYFLDPILYFQTLITLRSINHPLWSNVISNNKVVDAFFEMHANFILSLPSYSTKEYWDHRIYLSDTLFQLIEYIFVGNNPSLIIKNHPKASQFTIKLIECSIKLIKTAPYSVSAIFFLYLTRIFKIIQNKIPTEQIKPLYLQFLLNLDKSNSILIPLAVKFLLKMKPQVIPFSRIIKMISKRGIRNLYDMEILSSYCEGINILPVLTLLCKFSISNKLWHRACINEIVAIINKFQERNDVKDWFQLFIRRIFIFISIASCKHRYKTRTLLLVESLSSMMYARIFWLQQAILVCAASVWSTKLVPPYFKNFFPVSASQDDVIFHELELFANSDIILKDFPFDANKGTLVLPPFIDSHKNSKSSLAQRCSKQNITKSNSNNTNYNYNNFQTSSSSSSNISISASQQRRSSSRNDKSIGRIENSKVGFRTSAQKKRPEPLIKKPSGSKQSRPLASAICISPIQRR